MIARIPKKNFLIVFLLFLCPLVFFTQESQKLVSIKDLCTKLETESYYDPLSNTLALYKNGHVASFRFNDSLVFFDYKKVEIITGTLYSNGSYYVTEPFFYRLHDFFSSLPDPIQYRVGAILIDPGHGGKDPGASGSAKVNGKTITINEKDIVLDTSLDLYERLVKKWPDKQILMTRTTDTYPSLEQRVEMANSVKLKNHEAILYISIHANSAFNKSSSGFEVWYLTPDYRRTVIDKTDDTSSDLLPILNSMLEEEFTTESILIAKSILDGLDEQIGSKSKNRGLKEEAWFVVRNARMPSVLIELGFVSNPEEAALLADPQYLKSCSLGIYNGINRFVEYFEGSKGFTQ